MNTHLWISIGLGGLGVAAILANILISKKVKRRVTSIFESTKTEGASLHEKCMFCNIRTARQCPAVIVVCNYNLTISPVIGAITEIPIKNLHIISEGGLLQNGWYPWRNKQLVTLQDDRNSAQFVLGLDNSEKFKNLVKTND